MSVNLRAIKHDRLRKIFDILEGTLFCDMAGTYCLFNVAVYEILNSVILYSLAVLTQLSHYPDISLNVCSYNHIFLK